MTELQNTLILHIVDGQWDECNETLDQMHVTNGAPVEGAKLLIREHRYLVAVRERLLVNALNLLRTEITPICDNHKRVAQLSMHLLSPDTITDDQVSRSKLVTDVLDHLNSQSHANVSTTSLSHQTIVQPVRGVPDELNDGLLDQSETDICSLIIHRDGKLIYDGESMKYLNGQVEVYEIRRSTFNNDKLLRLCEDIHLLGWTRIWYLLPNHSMNTGLREVWNDRTVAEMLDIGMHHDIRAVDVIIEHYYVNSDSDIDNGNSHGSGSDLTLTTCT